MKTNRFFVVLTAICCAISMAAAPAAQSKKKAPKKKPIKHYIDVHAGGGVSSFGYPLEGGSAGVGGSFSIGAGYTYFFLPYMGLQTGLTVTRIASNAKLTEPMSWTQNLDGSPLTDYTGDIYEHRVRFDNWKEQQQSYLLQIPVGLRFRYFQNRDSRAGLHAALGLNVSFPIASNYAHTAGAISHTGWYEHWQLELHDLPGRFETEPFTTRQEESIQRHLKKVNAMLYGELGTSIRLNERSEMFIAAYAQYMLNDYSAVKQSARTPLGFANDHNGYTFMPQYHGLIGTDKVGAMHPWVVGAKVGVSIWPGKTDKQKKRELRRLMKQYPDMVPVREVHDTIWVIDTIRLNDTVRVRDTIMRLAPVAIEPVVTVEERKLDTLLSQAVIWFDFDDYRPILEPAYILDSVATMMKRHPDVRIHVNGHACNIGADSYNKRLALKRAKAVAALLRAKGIRSDRMEINSYGATHPYRYNAEHQLSKDRRVEIIPEGYVADEEELQPVQADPKQEVKVAPQQEPKQEIQTAPQQEPKQEVKPEEKPAPQTDVKAAYTKFLGKEQVKEGSRLIQIARRWYNEPSFWVYIYEANIDKLQAPDDLKVGTTLQIPDLRSTVHKGISRDKALQDAQKRIKKYQ